jgi:hypothetical protein
MTRRKTEWAENSEVRGIRLTYARRILGKLWLQGPSDCIRRHNSQVHPLLLGGTGAAGGPMSASRGCTWS